MYCGDKSHEFVINYLNHLIENEAIKVIKLFVYEPSSLFQSNFIFNNSLVVQNEIKKVSFINDGNLKGILNKIIFPPKVEKKSRLFFYFSNNLVICFNRLSALFQ